MTRILQFVWLVYAFMCFQAALFQTANAQTCPAYNFNVNQVLSYGSDQDLGPSAVQDNGATLYMDGNAWKGIEVNYTVTSNTVLSFDFKSTVEGELHEVSFDNDLTLERDHYMVFYGTQTYTDNIYSEDYSGNGNWQTFVVDIGKQFTGTYKYMLLTADDDANLVGNSFFRNVKLFEDNDGDDICNASDVCPNGDDNADTNNNGLPDACEPCSIYNFNTYPVIGYDSGQDFGPGIVQDGGATVYMDGNAWKAVEVNYNVTPQTVITFDFKSTIEGEIHEVGFDNDLTLAPDHRMVVYGNQGYGGNLNNATYSGNGNWQNFTVDIGSQFTGTFKYLVLSADDDANATGNSYFRNIKMFEDTDGDLACDIQCTPGEACNDNDACTTGETFDNNCNCVGGTIPDADGDGQPDVCQSVIINEILTQNYGSVTNLYDEDGDSPDYIELHNITNTTVDLSGWKLVDEDNLWKFPAGASIAANGYLTVWASEKDRTANQYHTNFQLSSKGEYLGLYNNQNQLIYDFGVEYPEQYSNLSYGSASNGVLNYFNQVTKDAVNSNAYSGKVAIPTAVEGRGYYQTAVNEILETETSGAEIRYTLNGFEVDENSPLFNGSITITPNNSGIVTLRAKAFLPGYVASDEASFSYIFPNNIFPNSTNAQQGISSLPMIILNSDVQNNFECINNDSNNCPKREIMFEYFETDEYGDITGIYEKAGASEFGQGNVSLADDRQNFRVHFDTDYGNKFLKYPIFENYEYTKTVPVEKFRKLEIRGCYFDSYEGEENYPQSGAYITENWYRSTELHLNKLGQHSRFVNVFINGEFRGVSTLRERFDHHHYEEYKEVDSKEVSALKLDTRLGSTNTINGNTTYWDAVKNETNYQNVKDKISVKSLVTHKIMESLWFGNGEGEFRIVYPTSPIDDNKLYVLNADADMTFKPSPTVNGTYIGWEPSGYHTYDFENRESLAIWYEFINDPEFVQEVIEETTKAFCSGGILSVAEAKQNLNNWVLEVEDAMHAELLRNNRVSYDYDYNSWQNRIDMIDNMLGTLGDLHSGWAAQGMFQGCNLRPTVDTENQISEINSPVSYFVDAIDPDSDAITFSVVSGMPPGLNINASTGEFTGMPTQLGTYEVKIKVEDSNNKWGYHYFSWEVINLNVPTGGELIINEIHYNPLDSILSNGGEIDDDNFEFIEVKNIGTADVILRGKIFTKGIDLEIDGTLTIAPGNFAVFANDSCWFEIKYGFFPDAVYTNKLDNGGEYLRLKGPYKSILDSLTYDDVAPWDDTPDGSEYSLALKGDALDNSLATSWAAQAVYTTPRAENIFCTPATCDSCDDTLAGTACDDGDDCTTGEVYDTDCNCIGGTFADSDNDTVCDADDICAGADDNADADGDGTPDGCDNCDSITAGTACNDNDPCTINDVLDNNCNCAGTFADADADDVCDDSDICPNGDDTADADGDSIPDACDSCDNTLTGTACDDGDACTNGETYDANCDCVGGIFQDADGDTVCDADDICTNGDDAVDSDNDGTPDDCDSCPNDANDACGLPSNYCTANATNSNYEYIANVTVGDINNTSGANGGYSDYTNISGTGILGSTLPVSLTAGYPGSSYPENWIIWIDLNRDGDYTDAGEEVFSGSGTGTVTGSINIPNNASPGTTGMRVAMQWNNNASPCGSFTYGEVEDYSILLNTTGNGRIASPTFDEMSLDNTVSSVFKAYPNPAREFIYLDLTNVFRTINANQMVQLRIFGTDGKLQWQNKTNATRLIEVDINDLPANQYYLISIESKGINQLTSKFLKL